ncbi:hypothetical protein A2U01_0061410, partial [Trifolium medium]|nr:hypothetical protein [Trifolium medium]
MVFKKWFKKMEITLEEVYRAFLKEMEELREKELRKQLPPKLPDPGKFTIPCSIQGVNIEEALLDLGSSISLMSLQFAKKWEIGEIDEMHIREIILADQSVLRPRGIIRDTII